MIVGAEECTRRVLDEVVGRGEEEEGTEQPGWVEGHGPHLALCLNWLHRTQGTGFDCPENLFKQWGQCSGTCDTGGGIGSALVMLKRGNLLKFVPLVTA